MTEEDIQNVLVVEQYQPILGRRLAEVAIKRHKKAYYLKRVHFEIFTLRISSISYYSV